MKLTFRQLFQPLKDDSYCSIRDVDFSALTLFVVQTSGGGVQPPYPPLNTGLRITRKPHR